MPMDSRPQKILILLLSIVFVGFIIMFFIMDKTLEWDATKYVTCVLCSIWGFFFFPMIRYIINWFKILSFEEAFDLGYKIGYYGIGILVIIDPIIGIMYYLNKRLISRNNNSKIIMIGWYIQ